MHILNVALFLYHTCLCYESVCFESLSIFWLPVWYHRPDKDLMLSLLGKFLALKL